jgi:hypothetical protein
MKAGKIALAVAAVIVLTAGIAAWWMTQNADRFVREAVIDIGGELVDTRVTVDDVRVDLVRGTASISGLRIANPPGYSQRPALLLGSVEVDIALASIGKEVLVIERVRVTDPEVSFEVDEAGVSNISVLEGNIAKAPPGGASANEGLLIIEQADFSGGTITAISAHRLGKELVFGFPNVSFTGLGAPGGTSAEQIGNEMSAVLMDRIIDAAQQAGVQSLLESQKERAIEKAREKLKEKVGDIFGGDDG